MRHASTRVGTRCRWVPTYSIDHPSGQTSSCAGDRTGGGKPQQWYGCAAL